MVIKNEKKTLVVYAVGIIIIAGAAWYLFGNVSDDRARIDQIESDISTTRQQQSTVIKRLDTIETGLAESTKRVDDIKDTVGTVENRISISKARADDSAGLIKEGREIVSGIFQRGQSGEN